jgi:protoheme IX farnesyltransferase
MSMPSATYAERRSSIAQRANCYFELAKPKIAALELVTVAIAAFIGSWTRPDPWLVLHTLVGTALVAASASALNQWIERRSDLRMERTANRPLPSGRIPAAEVAFVGGLIGFIGIAYLAMKVNAATATIGFLSWFLYVVIYTPMKQRSPANTVVGAVAGALPVLMGWTAVDAPLALSSGGLQAATLFFIVYLWQFPHFMAIAWIYRRQYAAAEMKMLTVVDPTGRRAGVQAIVASAALLPVSLLPLVVGSAGLVYLAGAMSLSAVYIYCSGQFLAQRSEFAARRLLWASLVYLPALLALLALVPLV